MTHIYKGEYLDVATLYIGQKIEEGFKLIRDQLSMADATNNIADLAVAIRTMKTEQVAGMANIYSVLDALNTKATTTNRHLVNLKHLAPPTIVVPPTIAVVPPPPVDTTKVETPNDMVKQDSMEPL